MGCFTNKLRRRGGSFLHDQGMKRNKGTQDKNNKGQEKQR